MDGASPPGLMDLLVKKMSYLNQRQAVLAENVANADTPGFKQRDVAPFTFGDAMKQASFSMETTDAKHIIPASMAGANAKTVKEDGIEVLPTGNSVDIEEQMMEVSKTAVDYQGITGIYHAISGMFKVALKGSSS